MHSSVKSWLFMFTNLVVAERPFVNVSRYWYFMTLDIRYLKKCWYITSFCNIYWLCDMPSQNNTTCISLEDELRFFTDLHDSVILFNDPWMSSQRDSSLIWSKKNLSLKSIMTSEGSPDLGLFLVLSNQTISNFEVNILVWKRYIMEAKFSVRINQEGKIQSRLKSIKICPFLCQQCPFY